MKDTNTTRAMSAQTYPNEYSREELFFDKFSHYIRSEDYDSALLTYKDMKSSGIISEHCIKDAKRQLKGLADHLAEQESRKEVNELLELFNNIKEDEPVFGDVKEKPAWHERHCVEITEVSDAEMTYYCGLGEK